jgi:hypothetical protein
VLDTKANKLVIATSDTTASPSLWLHRCDRDGANCVRTIAEANRSNYAFYLSAIFDDATGQTLTISRDNNVGGKAVLYRCATGGSCSRSDASAGRPDNSHTSKAAMAIYPESGALFFASASLETGNSFRVGIYRCKTDGSECKHQWVTGTDKTYNLRSLTIDPEGVVRVLVTDSAKGVTAFSFNAW